MNNCYIDTEVKSEVNLKLAGAAKYFESPTTKTIIVTYQIDELVGTEVWDITLDPIIPPQLAKACRDPNNIFWAFNAAFDMQALENLGIDIPLERWRCLMVAGLSLSFQGGLDDMLARMGIPHRKERDGKKLIRKFCMPQPKNWKVQNWDRHNAPEDWEKFIRYAITDTDVLVPMHAWILEYGDNVNWSDWHMDQRINRRGLPIDVPLVDQAIMTSVEEKAYLLDRMKEISGVDNPNSKPQVKVWLRDVQKIHLANMQKATVALALTNPNLSPAAREMLQLNQRVSMTSTSKWDALNRAVCVDDRLRYAHQYLGAARTGRDAHRLFQPSNLPRGTLYNAPAAADMLLDDFSREDIDLVYGNVMEVLSSTIRCAITAPEGQALIVADLAGIEGRVLPWLCGFEKKLDQISGGLDMYKVAAEDVLGTPYEQVNKAERFKGKVCLGADTRVVTSNGVKYITDVSKEDLLWDGDAFVNHDGIIFNGHKETLKWKGINATPEHKVLALDGWHTVSDVLKSETISRSVLDLGSLPSSITNKKLRKTGMEKLRHRDGTPESVVIAGESTHQKTPHFLKKRFFPATPAVSNVHTLFGTPDFEKPYLIRKSGANNFQDLTVHLADVITQNVRVSTTMAVEALKFVMSGAAIRSLFSNTSQRLRIGIPQTLKWTGLIPTVIMRRETFDLSRKKKTAKTDEKSQNSKQESTNLNRVYDIVNAGPRHRFTVLTEDGEPVIAANCELALGYQGGPNALNKMAVNLGGESFQEHDALRIVKGWRKKNKPIVRYWYACEEAVKLAIRNPGNQYPVHKVVFFVEGDFLFIQLPSGRKLAYQHPEYSADGFTYMGLNGYTRKWERLDGYGGKSAENLSQAVARDIFFHGLRMYEELGGEVVLRVHDELVSSVPEEESEVWMDRLIACMETVPEWAAGLPLKAEGFTSRRYRK